MNNIQEKIDLLASLFDRVGVLPRPNINYEEADEQIVVDSWLISEVNIPKQTIYGVQSGVGYALSVGVFNSNGYWDPPDFDVKELKQALTFEQIAKECVLAYVASIIDARLENIAIEKQIKEGW